MTRSLFTLLVALLAAAAGEELERHWRRGALADSGRVYYWRPSEDGSAEPEISFSVPDEHCALRTPNPEPDARATAPTLPNRLVSTTATTLPA